MKGGVGSNIRHHGQKDSPWGDRSAEERKIEEKKKNKSTEGGKMGP